MSVCEKLDGDDARGRREQRVFERAEAEHAHARLPVGDAGMLEGVDVDGEAAARDERPEAGRHRCDDVAGSELAVVLDPRNLAVGKDVPDVREHLRAERGHEPDRIDGPEPCRNVPEAGDPGDREERPERDQRGRNDEHERLRTCSFQMALYDANPDNLSQV